MLTSRTKQHYYLAQVLQTPKQKAVTAPVSKWFFYVHSFSMVERAANTILERGICPPSFCRFEALDRSHVASGQQLPSKEQKKMSAKPCASRRRKPNPSSCSQYSFFITRTQESRNPISMGDSFKTVLVFS